MFFFLDNVAHELFFNTMTTWIFFNPTCFQLLQLYEISLFQELDLWVIHHNGKFTLSGTPWVE
jgi:hypothetical protein